MDRSGIKDMYSLSGAKIRSLPEHLPRTGQFENKVGNGSKGRLHSPYRRNVRRRQSPFVHGHGRNKRNSPFERENKLRKEGSHSSVPQRHQVEIRHAPGGLERHGRRASGRSRGRFSRSPHSDMPFPFSERHWKRPPRRRLQNIAQ